MDTDQQKIIDLIEKIKSGIISPEEELELLKFLNTGVIELRDFIRNIAPAKE